MTELDDLARRVPELEVEGRRLKRVLSVLDIGDYLVILALMLVIFFAVVRFPADKVPDGFSYVKEQSH